MSVHVVEKLAVDKDELYRLGKMREQCGKCTHRGSNCSVKKEKDVGDVELCCLR